ncbi:MAG: hypothetical protein LBV30_04740 [Propionibacteriaceae bacterium]|jgi:hypothetical protein|nr:hypothetical protein [Propionibacteriaceae bacterium]
MARSLAIIGLSASLAMGSLLGAFNPAAQAATPGLMIDLSGAKVNANSDGTVAATTDALTFNYGPDMQYGDSFVYFPVNLPAGAKLSDYQSISYDLQTNAPYGGKKEGVLATVTGAMPAAMDYDYGATRANNAINLWNGGLSSTAALQQVTRTINRANAALIGASSFDLSIYIHMEHAGGTAAFTIANVRLNPADAPLDNAAVEVIDGSNSNPANKGISLTMDGQATVSLSRALQTGETLTVQALDASGAVIKTWSLTDTASGIFAIDDVDALASQSMTAQVSRTDGSTSSLYTMDNHIYSDALQALMSQAKLYSVLDYTNGVTLPPAMANGQTALDNPQSSNADYKAAFDGLTETLAALDPILPFAALTPAADLPQHDPLPDVLTMLDGTKVTDADQWPARDAEIRQMLQFYEYGIWRDGSDEQMSYEVTTAQSCNWWGQCSSTPVIHVTITRPGRLGTASFNMTYKLPEGVAPAGGWPVIVGVGGVGQEAYALANGYATISINPGDLAADDTSRTGQFFNLYPYLNSWTQQSGNLVAWAWGASKVLDALEAGAGAELGISTGESWVNGVSRYGKAAAVAGAFEERFTVSMPTCSGYGGLTIMRYASDGLTYDMQPWFSPDYPGNNGADSAADFAGGYPEWTSMGGNEPMASHQNNGWMNETYKQFKDYNYLPYDAHFLAALSAAGDRYLYMVMGVDSDPWSAPPGMWYDFESVLPVFELLGTGDHLANNIHADLHGVEREDLEKGFAWIAAVEHGQAVDQSALSPEIQGTLTRTGLSLLESLHSSVFDTAANQAAYDAGKPAATSPSIPDSSVITAAEAASSVDGSSTRFANGRDAYAVTVWLRNEFNESLTGYAQALRLIGCDTVPAVDRVTFTDNGDGSYQSSFSSAVVGSCSPRLVIDGFGFELLVDQVTFAALPSEPSPTPSPSITPGSSPSAGGSPSGVASAPAASASPAQAATGGLAGRSAGALAGLLALLLLAGGLGLWRRRASGR